MPLEKHFCQKSRVNGYVCRFYSYVSAGAGMLMLVRLASRVASLKRKSSRPLWLMRLLSLEAPSDDLGLPERHQFHRGLIMVQIDGLGHDELHNAMARSELPFLKSLVEKQHYEVHSMYSGIPSSTPAVQAELFYGVKTAVPAFAYFKGGSGELQRMYDPVCAKAMEMHLKNQGRPLLEGGSAYSNIYTGGASESHYCAASFGFGHSLETFKPLARLGIGLIFLPTLFRTIALELIELVLGLVDFVRGVFSGHRVLPELKFVLARVAVCIGLRDLVSIGAQVDILRGLPIVHVNLLGYDEQSHRRGPHSAFAHWTLRGIDRCIKRLWQAGNESTTRHYDLWIYSDHGQESTQPYEQRSGRSLTDALNEAMQVLDAELVIEPTESNKKAVASVRARYLGGRFLQRFLLTTSTETSSVIEPVYRVAAMGPIGHVYANILQEAQQREALAIYMSTIDHVPAVMYLDSDDAVVVQTSESQYCLPSESVKYAGQDHTFGHEIGADLVSVCRHKDAGQVILLGWSNHTTPVSFPIENGAHAGPGSRETHAFALLPSDTELTQSAGACLRPLNLRNAAFAVLDQDPALPTSNRFPRPRIVPATSLSGLAEQQKPLVQPKGNKCRQKLRLMTYNVHGCVGMDGRHAPERIARVIAHFEPDIVALQELDVNRTRSRQTDQTELIARLLEMKYHFHPSMHFESGAYGNAILTHLPMRIVKAEQLPTHPAKANLEPRGAIWATIEIADRELQVICTHLGLYPEERLRQVQMLQSEQWLDHDSFHLGPAILCGDFNATPGSAALRALDSCWKDVQSNDKTRPTSNYKTFSSMLPALRIDHVFANGELTASGVQVPRFELARRASDHLPLVVDFDLDTSDSVRTYKSIQRSKV